MMELDLFYPPAKAGGILRSETIGILWQTNE